MHATAACSIHPIELPFRCPKMWIIHKAFVVLVLLGVIWCNRVCASHFRGGIIMVRPQPGGTEYEVGLQV